MGYPNGRATQRKGGLGDRFGWLACDELPLPIASMLQVSWGPLEVRGYKPVGE